MLIDRVEDNKIGRTDLLDQCTVFLNIHLVRRTKNTHCKLNVGILNNQEMKEEIKCCNEEKNSPVDDIIICNTGKT